MKEVTLNHPDDYPVHNIAGWNVTDMALEDNVGVAIVVVVRDANPVISLEKLAVMLESLEKLQLGIIKSTVFAAADPPTNPDRN